MYNFFISPEKHDAVEKKHFFTQVRDYPVSRTSLVAWGCVCPKCGALHKFTTGDEWNFCPACGCSTKED